MTEHKMGDNDSSSLKGTAQEIPVLWLTGGTRGLGRAVAKAMAPTYEIALSYRADDSNADLTRAQIIEDTGKEPLLLRGDLSQDGKAPSQLDEIIGRYGRLNALVHCVALASFKPCISLKPRELRRILAYSFEAFHQVVLAAAEPLMATRGSIVAVSSLGGRRAINGYGGLGAAKAALESYSRHLAVDMAPYGVRVNIVSPGVLHTSSLARLNIGQEVISQIEARTPLARLVTKEEVAAVIAMLLSDASSGMTGQTVTVDGGYEIVA